MPAARASLRRLLNVGRGGGEDRLLRRADAQLEARRGRKSASVSIAAGGLVPGGGLPAGGLLLASSCIFQDCPFVGSASHAAQAQVNAKRQDDQQRRAGRQMAQPQAIAEKAAEPLA